MFYIIASRIPLVYSDTTNRKFLKIFILGSLLYIFIHYYLHLELRSGIIDKVKSKLLFVMAGDFAIACALAKFLSPIVSSSVDGETDETEDKPKYLANEKERIMKELEDRRKAEMLRNQQAQLAAQQAQMLAQHQAQLAAQQSVQLAAQKTAQVKVQEADKADKTKLKPKSRKKDTSSSSSSTSTSTSTESEKPKKSDKKVEKKSKKDKHSSDEESTEMPVYE